MVDPHFIPAGWAQGVHIKAQATAGRTGEAGEGGHLLTARACASQRSCCHPPAHVDNPTAHTHPRAAAWTTPAWAPSTPSSRTLGGQSTMRSRVRSRCCLHACMALPELPAALASANARHVGRPATSYSGGLHRRCPGSVRAPCMPSPVPSGPSLPFPLRRLSLPRPDDEALGAFQLVSRLEGIIPALETSHALAFLDKLAPTVPDGTRIVLNCSGRGDKDVTVSCGCCLVGLRERRRASTGSLVGFASGVVVEWPSCQSRLQECCLA